VADLPGTLARLKREGVKVLAGPRRFGTSTRRAAEIEGPDHMVLELVGPPR
jgi:hypothetical protein